MALLLVVSIWNQGINHNKLCDLGERAPDLDSDRWRSESCPWHILLLTSGKATSVPLLCTSQNCYQIQKLYEVLLAKCNNY